MSCTAETQTQQQPEIDFPEISVNGVLIEQETLAKELQYHPADSVEDAIGQAAQALIIQELLVQEAKKKGLNKEVKKQGSETTEEALIRTLIDVEVQAPQSDDTSCKRYFVQNRQRFRSPDIIEACHILIAADAQDAEERDKARQKAEAILETLQENPNQFVALVKEHSDCPSKETDGNLGQLSKGQTTPELERQLFMLEPGLAKHPIESRYGFHIVRVDRKIEGEPLEFEHVKDKIANYLSEQGNRRALSQYLHGLMEAAVIEGIDVNEFSSPLTQ